jgi:hypothetical protein
MSGAIDSAAHVGVLLQRARYGLQTRLRHTCGTLGEMKRQQLVTASSKALAYFLYEHVLLTTAACCRAFAHSAS